MEKTNYEKHRDELMKDPEFRKEYDRLTPKYKRIRAKIEVWLKEVEDEPQTQS